ncbi:hypothetical protein [Paenibacillus aceti]|uniref:Peptidase A2 domain-containing protein n=1 Tax=Paenibacillus aceti TaxID=1820010 RepID=A0ABQ1W1L9_9BACL|nr:hypothetical protein [Paenibacillus aceti]GGG06807.1 hypothetical protein GCM10010913_30770 [Paenibacillus aceti]
MNIAVENGLPFVSVRIYYRGKKLELRKVLLDTGSASTLLKADVVGEIGIVPEGNDVVDTIRGVEGIEYVYTKTLDGVDLQYYLEMVRSGEGISGLAALGTFGHEPLNLNH